MPGTAVVTTFAGTAPPWSLPSLDTNFVNVNALLASANNYALYLADTGAANAYVVTFGAGITLSLAAGLMVQFKATNSNTGASTLNASATGVKNILNPDGSTLSAGQIPTGAIVQVQYDGTQYQLQSVGPAPVVNNGVCQGRLTLTTVTPVTTADVLAAVTVYFTPYDGNKIALYDGTAVWTTYSFAEISIAVPAAASQMYDLWAYSNAGVVALEALAWTNDTTRATALALQNGVYVKSGATTRRYLGSFRTTTVAGQTEDSAAKRYLWNYYNRVMRLSKVTEATPTWTYNTNAWRQANAAAANQLDYVIGVAEEVLQVTVIGSAANNVATGQAVVGVGVGSTTGNSAVIYSGMALLTTPSIASAHYLAAPVVGRQFYAWLESGLGVANTTTWYGSGGSVQSGITGFLRH